MSDVQTEKKLSSFKSLIMRDIEEKKELYNKELEEYKESLESAAKDEALQRAYGIIQREKNAIIKERHEKESKFAAEKKKELLKYRDEILNKIYSQLDKRLEEYRKTSEYEKFMIKTVTDGINALGGGDVIAYIDKADEFMIEKLESETGAKIEITENKIIGGARVKSMTKNMICDNSLAEKLEENKTEFFEHSGLFI